MGTSQGKVSGRGPWCSVVTAILRGPAVPARNANYTDGTTRIGFGGGDIPFRSKSGSVVRTCSADGAAHLLKATMELGGARMNCAIRGSGTAAARAINRTDQKIGGGADLGVCLAWVAVLVLLFLVASGRLGTAGALEAAGAA